MMSSTISAHVCEVRPLKDKLGVDLISDALPFGRLWMASRMPSRMQSDTPNTAADHMMHCFGFTMKLAT